VTKGPPNAETGPELKVHGEAEPTPAEVRDELERVRKSETIAGSEKLVQFLTFVVESTLSGEARYLKETIIGVSVFGRSPDYDPKTDTVVRSQAWRLRAKLNEYYRSEGVGAPVIIDIPRGSYVPVFLRRRRRPTTECDISTSRSGPCE
jgi:hypothetical protein